MSADRIAAQLARQPGLGSAGPAAMPASAPQAAPAIVTLLPGICADIHLGVELPRRFCGDWDGLDAAPAWFRDTLVWEAAAAPTIRAIVYRERTIGSVTAWPDPMASAARLWRRVRLAGGLALGVAAATLLLNWLAVTRLVAPVGRIVHGLENLDAASTRPPLPRFAATEFDRIAHACNALADRLADTEAERAGLMQRLVTVQEEERQALARDLHDAFGQCLAAAGARAAAIELAAPPGARRSSRGRPGYRSHYRHHAGEPAGSPGPPRTARSRRGRIGGGAAWSRGGLARTTQVRAGPAFRCQGGSHRHTRERGGEPLPDRAGTADERLAPRPAEPDLPAPRSFGGRTTNGDADSRR